MSAAPATTLLAALQLLTDPRCRRGIRHPFAAVLALTFLGLLCRQTDFATIARWAKAHWDALRPALGFTRRYAPHATTLTRVTAAYSLAEFQDALCRWLAGLLAREPVRTAAVDGKTSKQGHDADGDPIHVLNVFAHDAHICLAQWAVGDGKETEPEVLKAHLGELFAAHPALRLLTGDALFCQRPLARLIVEAGRAYLFAIKDNQPDLHEAAQTAFADATPETADAGTREKGGAVVTRRLWLDVETADYAREKLSFPGLRILLRVDSETRGGEADPKTETRYFATALDPGCVTPDGLLAAVRGHWQVENGLHFIKDRWWDEDRHYSTQAGVALGFAVLLNAVVTVLRATADPEDDLPLRTRRRPGLGCRASD